VWGSDVNSTPGLLCRRPGFTSGIYGHFSHTPLKNVIRICQQPFELSFTQTHTQRQKHNPLGAVTKLAPSREHNKV